MAVKKRQKVLSHGRPPNTKVKEQMSSKASRSIIRTHHRLHKERAAAVKKGDTKAAEALEKAIEENGGIKVYQAASKQGQDKLRGGDSSKVLVEWLRETNILDSISSDAIEPRRLLEIGALSTNNEISQFPKLINVTRIDLNSQERGIEKQDFMERPLPSLDNERFDIISLSLVLNYVPDPVGRGEMLKRITQFLCQRRQSDQDTLSLPALFFVLPLPCVANSRYLDETTLLQIMSNRGFEVKKKRDTNKLCYYFFVFNGETNGRKTLKKLIRDGPSMNNFSIVVT